MVVFAAPGDEGGLGSLEFGFQARKGPAMGAEFDEAVQQLRFFGVHATRVRAES